MGYLEAIGFGPFLVLLIIVLVLSFLDEPDKF